MVDNKLNHAFEGVRVGFVHCLKDDLPQALLPLCGQQQTFYEVPTIGAVSGQKRSSDMVAHNADFVFALRGGNQQIE